MKETDMYTVTSLSVQARNRDRVNVSIDGKYCFSLDISQVVDLGVKVGKRLSDEALQELQEEGQFGKLYGRALEYALRRPHSLQEMQQYLRRKTLARRTKDGTIQKGYAPGLADRVLRVLQQKGYVDDKSFAVWWVENRNVTKGTSTRKLITELRAKGVAGAIIEQTLERVARNDSDELEKIMAKKRTKYADEQKLIQYLVRQGFSYDDVRAKLREDNG